MCPLRASLTTADCVKKNSEYHPAPRLVLSSLFVGTVFFIRGWPTCQSINELLQDRANNGRMLRRCAVNRDPNARVCCLGSELYYNRYLMRVGKSVSRSSPRCDFDFSVIVVYVKNDDDIRIK